MPCLCQGQNDFSAIQEEICQHILEKRRFYEVNIYFEGINAILRRIHFPDVKKQCNPPNWMTMPGMGDPIANVFSFPVFFFSHSYSQTCFPAMFPPKDNPPIFINFSGTHFVAVWLKNPLLFPAPSVQIYWEIAAEQEAIDWQKEYAKLFELTATIKALSFSKKYEHC